MTEWKSMYILLCKAISAALDQLAPLPQNAAAIRTLSSALQAAEELYVQSGEE